jgi:hypothetical protein
MTSVGEEKRFLMPLRIQRNALVPMYAVATMPNISKQYVDILSLKINVTIVEN